MVDRNGIMRGKKPTQGAKVLQGGRTGATESKVAETTEVAEVAKVIAARYYLIESTVLEDTFVLCIDKKLLKRVRQKFSGIILYFLQEMEELMALEGHMEQEEWCNYVRVVHKVKKMCRGWIIPGQVPKAEGNKAHA